MNLPIEEATKIHYANMGQDMTKTDIQAAKENNFNTHIKDIGWFLEAVSIEAWTDENTKKINTLLQDYYFQKRTKLTASNGLEDIKKELAELIIEPAIEYLEQESGS